MDELPPHPDPTCRREGRVGGLVFVALVGNQGSPAGTSRSGARGRGVAWGGSLAVAGVLASSGGRIYIRTRTSFSCAGWRHGGCWRSGGVGFVGRTDLHPHYVQLGRCGWRSGCGMAWR